MCAENDRKPRLLCSTLCLIFFFLILKPVCPTKAAAEERGHLYRTNRTLYFLFSHQHPQLSRCSLRAVNLVSQPKSTLFLISNGLVQYDMPNEVSIVGDGYLATTIKAF